MCNRMQVKPGLYRIDPTDKRPEDVKKAKIMGCMGRDLLRVIVPPRKDASEVISSPLSVPKTENS